MSKRRKIFRRHSGRKRPVGRRAVAPPELLEPRNAPGVYLHLSWLTEPANLADDSIVNSLAASPPSQEVTQEGSKITAWMSEDDASQSIGSRDQLGLLGDDAALGAASLARLPQIKRAQAPVPPTAGNMFLAQPVHAFVHDAVSVTVPSLRTAVVTKEDTSEAPAVLKVLPPSHPSTATTGSSGGGGSSSSLGGGPPAGGGGRETLPPLPQQPAATVVANVPSVANTVAAPSVVAAQSPPSAASSATSSTVASTPLAAPEAPDAVPLPVASPNALTLTETAPPDNAKEPAAATPSLVVSEIAAMPLDPPVAPAATPAPVEVSSNSSPAALHAPAVAAAAVAVAGPVITETDVQTLLDRASAATPRNDAIIAVVDRGGRILGVRVEDGVSIDPDSDTMVFAIDGAVAKARTAAFFSSDSAPLTSRTVRFISQTTIAQREVESNPNETDPTKQGPGFVAPIGLGGHFPPDVRFTPHVDLFAIEHTNRDSLTHPGEDAQRGTIDDVMLGTRFGADFAYGGDVPAPESYGVASGKLETAQGRGIATLPGGMPLFKRDPDDMNRPKLVGGIGVFFPGPDGYATFEQNFQHASARRAAGKQPQTTNERLNAPLVKQAEYTAFAAAGGVGTIAGVALPADYVVLRGRIDLAGIKLEIYGPHPHDEAGLVAFGKKLGVGVVGGDDMPVTTGGDLQIAGQPVPDGWLVEPRASDDLSLTEADVRKIIDDGVAEAMRVRAAIRLPLGSRTRMVLSVTDTNGEILGLYRMPDATFFSIDVAVAKARNVAYYADKDALQPEDRVDANFDGKADVPAGTALTNRTFRYLATPFFPTGVDTSASGPFSILNDPGINRRTAENIGSPLPADQYTSVLGYDAFNPGTNFRELSDANAVPGNQNGIVFFPGSTPIYKNGQLVGGFGVSGDGVDQDDVVTFGGAGNFLPRPNSSVLRADETFVRGVRLPYQKFSRNARA